MRRLMPTVCGLWCDECSHYPEECSGCEDEKGMPFWTEYVNIRVCPVYECCVAEKGHAHCGHCSEMPCERFTRFKDPEHSEEEAARIMDQQASELRRRLVGDERG